MQLFLSILSFLVANRNDIKQVIVNIENLIPDAPGSSKAAAVRQFIGAALQIEDKIEAAWPMVAPIFNMFVADTKSGK